MKYFFQEFLVFFHWLFNINIKLESPVNSEIFTIDQSHLFGVEYFFKKIETNVIKSPTRGTVLKKFHDNKTITIANNCGFQVMITIKLTKAGEEKQSDLFVPLVKEGDHIKKSQNIFKINDLGDIEAVIIYVPWQPIIIKKIEGVKIYYRNPWSSLNTRLHGEYI